MPDQREGDGAGAVDLRFALRQFGHAEYVDHQAVERADEVGPLRAGDVERLGPGQRGGADHFQPWP